MPFRPFSGTGYITTDNVIATWVYYVVVCKYRTESIERGTVTKKMYGQCNQFANLVKFTL